MMTLSVSGRYKKFLSSVIVVAEVVVMACVTQNCFGTLVNAELATPVFHRIANAVGERW
jgi:hypothetical protein